MEKALVKLHKQIIPAFSEKIIAALEPGEAANYRNIKIFPIGLLKKADWNYKEEDEAMSAKLRANIQRNGQIENIHLRLLPSGYYEIINGNHRYDELLALGKKTVLAYDHGECSIEEAIRKCLETNETVFKGDNSKLAMLVKQLSEGFDVDELLQSLPFSEKEFNDLKKMVIVNPILIATDEIPNEINTLIKEGDVFKVGQHRIMCGDSTNKEHVDLLMNNEQADMLFWDPPYGVSASGGRQQTKEDGVVKKRVLQKIENDELRGGGFTKVFRKRICLN